MNSDDYQQVGAIRAEDSSGRRFALVLGGASILTLLGAGGLLWWRHGAAIFSEIALAGLAWCF